jgi:hypothetical protein
MSRLSVLERHQLTPEFSKHVEHAEAAGQATILFQVLGHAPEMLGSYFRFYFPWHTGGSVDLALKELVRLKVAQLNDCFT